MPVDNMFHNGKSKTHTANLVDRRLRMAILWHDHFSLGVGLPIYKQQKPSHKSLQHCNLPMLQNQRTGVGNANQTGRAPMGQYAAASHLVGIQAGYFSDNRMFQH